MSTSTIHLDTSFLIRALVPGSDADQMLRSWLREGRRLAMSSIAWTEFLCGPLDLEGRDLAQQIVAERVSFDDQDAASAAELFNETGRRRGSLLDCMIAAAARRRGAALATTNVEDFRRFKTLGLRFASPVAPQADAETGDTSQRSSEDL